MQIATLEHKQLGLIANCKRKKEIYENSIPWAKEMQEKNNLFNLEEKIFTLTENIDHKVKIIDTLKMEQNFYYQTLKALNEKKRNNF